MSVSEADLDVMEQQLGRRPRGAVEVSYRTPDGQPAVVKTQPKLPDGTPFPTLYYLTDPRLTAEASRLEVAGVMKTMQARLATDKDLAADYQAAHEHYLAVRNEMGDLGTEFSGGGMPDRVKCLHVLIAYALAEGPDRVRLGSEAVALALENNPKLAGTALPADWPSAESLGTSMAKASTEPRRFASIDCGTNSIRLLISERWVDEEGKPHLRELNRDNIIVRLGQGVDANGSFAPEALSRVDAALQTYTDRMVEYGVEDVMMGATSATRDAANKEEFFALTAQHLGRIREGAQAQVISGEEEAKLSFSGAVSELPRMNRTDDKDSHAGTAADVANAENPATFHEGVCVIDLGGGSTEFVVHTEGELQAYSADMGCVRLTERFLHTQPPTSEEKEAARQFIAELLDEVGAKVNLAAVRRVVGVAGTMTTLSAITKGLESYDSEEIHLSTVPLEDFRAAALRLLEMTPEQRLELGPMHPGRADVVGGGALIIDAIAKLLLQRGLNEITVSEHDILDGMLTEVVNRNCG